jgi:long-chain acyl-CoA synthetase
VARSRYRRDRERRPGSIGLPIRGVEMKLADPLEGVGEIAIRGHNVVKGYWNNPEATTNAFDSDGFFLTGDLARADDDGYYFIVDRKKEMIIRGGFNVYPREIEEVIHEHPDVVEAALVGMPHDELGEEIGAAVVLKPASQADAGTSSASSRRAWRRRSTRGSCGSRTSCRRGPTGKILRREITPPVRV